MVIIGLLLFWADGKDIWVLPISVLIGVAAQNLLVWPAALVKSKRMFAKIGWNDKRIGEAIRRTLLPLAGLTINNSITAVEQMLASTLPSGSVALLNFGSRVPLGSGSTVASAVSIGGLPHYSKLATEESRSTLVASVR